MSVTLKDAFGFVVLVGFPAAVMLLAGQPLMAAAWAAGSPIGWAMGRERGGRR